MSKKRVVFIIIIVFSTIFLFFLIGIVLQLGFVLLIPFFTWYDENLPYREVEYKSMEPTIFIGEYVAIDHDVSFDQIQVDDIIAFHRPDTNYGSILVQRIVFIELETDDDASQIVWTRGDVNSHRIERSINEERNGHYYDFAITEKDYVGKVSKIYPDRLSAKNNENGRLP